MQRMIKRFPSSIAPLQVSVITPSFNQAQFLPENLASVASQTYPFIQHIVVDPGSVDGSRELAEAADVELIAEPDRGQSHGISKGFERSSGDILTWLNSDDFYPEPDVIKRVVSIFKRHPDVDVVYGCVDFVDEVGAFLRRGYLNDDASSLLRSFQHQVGVVQPGVFMRRRVFEALGGPSEAYEYCMDYEYWVRIASHGFRWKHLKDTLAHHRWWGGMKTSRGRGDSLLEHFRVCQKYFGYVHWRWIDRYAEYLTTSLDGIVTRARDFDIEEKKRHVAAVIERYVSQDTLRLISTSPEPAHSETRDYIERHCPGKKIFFVPAESAKIMSETSDDPNGKERIAWNVWDAEDADGARLKAYHVPNNFDRYFDTRWVEDELAAGRAKLAEVAQNRRDVCVIVGNGPSLKETDLAALEGADVIISNFAFLNKELASRATLLTVVNDLVAKQGVIDFNQSPILKVVPFWLANSINSSADTAFVSATVRPQFNGNIDGEFSWRSTVSFFNMQLAYALGYRKVLLIGFDHSYAQPEGVKEGDVIDQKAADENHFDPRYFQGKTWQAADTANMEATYEIARRAFESDGREIVNCSVGGKLETFRRGDLRREIEAACDAAYAEVVAALPTPWPIFLPTDKIAAAPRLAGVKRVQRIYDERLDAIYRPKLRALREQYKDRDRCFIIGNGPSLNQTDLAVLKDEVTFAVNGFFLKTKDLDWLPTFYVVEDHLVAEDRQRWINEFKGPTKLFPAYLGYCLDEGEDTIFFNHRPRKSFPHGYDFSADAAEVTYAGCTVTYTCMQLAFYLGFKEIYLIGVDASYQLPKDVERGDTYGVGVLDMKSDDSNHFHPDYFGKGFRWHDPQVDKMLEAYQEARAVTEKTDQRIYNATIGGKLEVFERKPFQSIFPGARAPEEVSQALTATSEAKTALPRVLVFDLTEKGDGTATGELKANVFANWPEDSYLQVFAKSGEQLGLAGAINDGLGSVGVGALEGLKALIGEFDPELILYRPVPDAPVLHQIAMETIRSLPDVPLVTWIMDDWPSRIETDDPAQFEQMNRDWLWLLARSGFRLSICEQMSDAFERRYGLTFQVIANGIDPEDWPERSPNHNSGFVVRYAGALADNMTARSIQRVAEAVEALSDAGHRIHLEIQTRSLWKSRQEKNFAKLTQTRFFTSQLPVEDYQAWLGAADAVLVGYNFDADSLRYIGLSMANKLPECLASGAPLIAHGPAQAATIAYVKEKGCALVIDSDDDLVVREALARLAGDVELRRSIAERGRTVAFTHHDIRSIRQRFEAMFREAVAGTAEGGPVGDKKKLSKKIQTTPGYGREHHVTVDETEVVAHILRERRGPSRVMLDVGAHFGSSAAYFDKLGWTIHCFEPDPSNRAKLVKRFGDNENVTIDTRAVSDKPAKGVSFFRSDESTGISGLHAFRETHREDGKVDVTTVREIVEARGITHVDFLKIDVEGFDFSVLKGVPWGQVMPDVIECEFEDLKTVPLGHTYKDVADYLQEKGYSVYLSEWHPIVRYGIQHDWFRVLESNDSLDPNAWGNILAFREDPGFEAVSAAFDAVMKRGKGAPSSPLAPTSTATPPAAVNQTPPAPEAAALRASAPPRSSYPNLAERARNFHPLVHRLGQFGMWCLRKARAHPWVSAGAVMAGAGLVLLALVSPQPFNYLLWGLILLGVVSAEVFLLAGFGAHMARRKLDELMVQRTAQTMRLRNLETRLVRAEKTITETAPGKELHGLEARLVRVEKAALAAQDVLQSNGAKSTSMFNLRSFQVFNRLLDEAQLDELASNWTALLGVETNRRRLGYMAHRACQLEGQMKGRLATSVETIVLRSMVCAAVRRDEVSILEIGTLFGIGAAAVYEAAVDQRGGAHITVIDPLDGYYAPGNMDLLTGARVTETALRQNWSLAPIPESDFTIIKQLSNTPEALEMAAKRMYDVLIIDGDHSYDGVKYDFDHYAGMVRADGYVIFDDYDVEDWPEIKRYVDTHIRGLDHLRFVGAAFRSAIFQVKGDDAGSAPADHI